MDHLTRRELARRALAGYASGPAAATEATEEALIRTRSASAVVVVEGVSDQMAVEALAERLGRDLATSGVVVLPIGGAHSVGRYLARLGPSGDALKLAGMCDVQEADVFRRAIAASGMGASRSIADMADLGFHVCVDDLEDELIRAAGAPDVESLFESQGDLRSFRSLQNQPAWRDRPVEAQMRRFLGSGARRKLRYARLLVGAIALDRMPAPLQATIAEV